MDDEGENNEGVVGHRRWFLYPYLRKVGVGYYPLSTHNMITYNLQYKPTGVFSISNGNGPGGGFQDRSVTLDHIIVNMTRDDGIPLEYDRIDLHNSLNSIAGMPGHLVWKLTDKSFKLITAGHSVHVQIYLLKDKVRDLLDYTVEFFDDQSETSICFYDNDATKCPVNVADENKFGHGQYSKYNSTEYSRTIITVAEDITIEGHYY